MPAAPLDQLRSLVGTSHVLTGVELSPYVVDGRTPEAAVFPGTLDEVRAVVEIAAGAGLPIIPWGGGTAASVGHPPAAAALVLGLRRLDRVLEHEPGDLTATAQAGMTMASLQAALGRGGQWLSLEAPQPERATLGGVIATNASGPRRHLYGTARDLVIGMTVVTGEGAVVRGGGKVVKNVAGYDLPKLFVGSYGTLGVIVEITVKLRPRPEDERFVAVRFERLADVGIAVRAVMASDLIPTSIDVLDGDAARVRALRTAAPTLVVGFDGLAEQVQWQCVELERMTAALGGRDAVPLAHDAWLAMTAAGRDAFGTPAAVMRLVMLPAHVTDAMAAGAEAAKARGLACAWTAHAGVGVATAALFSPRQTDVEPIAATLEAWRASAHASGGHATLEWAPLAVKARVPVWDDPGAAGRVMRRIKEQLDPKNVLNPGRFLAGI
ncbi:MAG: FAD-binding oxidoreductase [Candidatus Rokubacteria bacterium]|nr:FAD-binding oxidoreductase [Candidatus Rokubacteria bacterium]